MNAIFKIKSLTILIAGFFLLHVSSCTIVKDDNRYNVSDGVYRSNAFGKKGKVYVQLNNDTVIAYKLVNHTADKTNITFPLKKSGNKIPFATFSETSLDIDFLTIPFKYRPASANVPHQLNGNLNGAVYLGFRNDVYRFSYRKTPLNYFQRKTSHYGFSFGVLTGIGPTAVNPTVTNFRTASEYDGVVWLKGAAVIMAIDKFTLGFAAGWDNLIDRNSNIWIYENKPWFGLAFGLNLN